MKPLNNNNMYRYIDICLDMFTYIGVFRKKHLYIWVFIHAYLHKTYIYLFMCKIKVKNK